MAKQSVMFSLNQAPQLPATINNVNCRNNFVTFLTRSESSSASVDSKLSGRHHDY